MDYERVYKQFIADRRLKEPELLASGEYFEKHHVVPRSLGGGNGSENILALTAEDHLRGHLLLAQIHGGVQWLVIDFITGGREVTPTKRMLRIAASFRAKRAQSFKGVKNPRHDSKVYELDNVDGRKFKGFKFEFKELYGVSAYANFNLMLRGRAVNGWYLKGRRPKIGSVERSSGALNPNASKNIITLYDKNGKSVTGPQTEVLTKLKVCSARFASMRKGCRNHVNGWGLVQGWRSNQL